MLIRNPKSPLFPVSMCVPLRWWACSATLLIGYCTSSILMADLSDSSSLVFLSSMEFHFPSLLSIPQWAHPPSTIPPTDILLLSGCIYQSLASYTLLHPLCSQSIYAHLHLRHQPFSIPNLLVIKSCSEHMFIQQLGFPAPHKSIATASLMNNPCIQK